MNKTMARKLAKESTMDEIRNMFLNAKERIRDWTVVSSVNPSFTKGTAWNLFTGGFKSGLFRKRGTIHVLGKTNMIWEFGDYLDVYLNSKPPRKGKVKVGIMPPMHQKPDLNNVMPLTFSEKLNEAIK